MDDHIHTTFVVVVVVGGGGRNDFRQCIFRTTAVPTICFGKHDDRVLRNFLLDETFRIGLHCVVRVRVRAGWFAAGRALLYG